MKTNRVRRYQRGSLVQKNGRWVAKWHYAPGKQTTRVLGMIDRLVERQARIMLDELIHPMNLNPEQARRFETVERFVNGVYIQVKIELASGDTTQRSIQPGRSRHMCFL